MAVGEGDHGGQGGGPWQSGSGGHSSQGVGTSCSSGTQFRPRPQGRETWAGSINLWPLGVHEHFLDIIHLRPQGKAGSSLSQVPRTSVSQFALEKPRSQLCHFVGGPLAWPGSLLEMPVRDGGVPHPRDENLQLTKILRGLEYTPHCEKCCTNALVRITQTRCFSPPVARQDSGGGETRTFQNSHACSSPQNAVPGGQASTVPGSAQRFWGQGRDTLAQTTNLCPG